MDATAANQFDNDSGLAVSPAEALAAFQVARQHGENALRIFQSVEEEQRAMAAHWSGSSHGSYMNAAVSYNDEATEITRGLFNFITVSEEGVKQLQSADDV